MQFSAPEPDVRVQRINILLVNKNSVDTYAFLEALNRSTLRVLHAGPKQIRLVWTEWGVEFFSLVFSLFFPMFFSTGQTKFLSLVAGGGHLLSSSSVNCSSLEWIYLRLPIPIASRRRLFCNDFCLSATPISDSASYGIEQKVIQRCCAIYCEIVWKCQS